MPAVPRASTGVTITNPLVLYRALLATNRIDPDPAQHRLAIHLSKLYDRLRDYEPIVEYNQRISQISKALGSNSPQGARLDVKNTAPPPKGILASLFEDKEQKSTLALTRVLTSHEEAIELNSPRGLMLHGEVGTGKSMLIDLFADCLPNRKKKRWHFTSFMLEVMAKLEYLRRSRQTIIPTALGQQEDYSLLWLARDMISTSPILFLDEFQLPDRAASKIMTNLMTCFFHLGGVLIATSNRMPEELAKAAGMEFEAPQPRSSLQSLRQRIGLGSSGVQSRSSGLYDTSSDFSRFLEVLKARCEIWQMESQKDYRRREAEQDATQVLDDDTKHALETEGFDGLEHMSAGNIGLGFEQSTKTSGKDVGDSNKPASSVLPKQYFIRPESNDLRSADIEAFYDRLTAAELTAFPGQTTPIPWSPSSVRVYGRSVVIPQQHEGVAKFSFAELCESRLGPADYISIASTFHTLIVTDVPVLSIVQKNEARRFITLLDALYEARCKLLITAEAGPDNIFFPEQNRSPAEGEEVVSQDAILSETISEVYQDATAPFRPNISAYNDSTDPGITSPDEPDFTHARLAGFLSDDQLEDGPPNRTHRARPSQGDGIGRGDSIYGLDTAESDNLDQLRQRLAQQRTGPDFSKGGIFTGEDEKFAYKRARSRLWEMCGSRWWDRSNEIGAEEGWWRPLDKAVRRWEGVLGNVAVDDPRLAAISAAGTSNVSEPKSANDEGMLGSRDVNEKNDEVLYKYGYNASPFRRVKEPPPSFSPVHIWGNMKWGKKAGAWGQGVEDLDGRKSDREKMKQSASKSNTQSAEEVDDERSSR